MESLQEWIRWMQLHWISAVALVLPIVIIPLVSNLFVRESRRTRATVEQLSSTVQGAERARRGVIVCDYVDTGTLVTLATQYGVEAIPDEVEKSTGKKAGSKAEAGVTGLKGELSTEASEAIRTVYRNYTDPNVLTDEVLRAIEANAFLQKDLADVPLVGLKELRVVAEKNPTLDTVDALWRDMIGQAKGEQFAKIARANDYLLIDSMWAVARDADAEMLQLELRQLGHGDGAVEMPTGASARVSMVTASFGEPGSAVLTSQGRQRLQPGANVRATVFGRPGSFDATRRILYISPVAVFTWLGRPSR